MTEATAEIAFLLLLGAARRAYEGESLVRSGQWQGWTPTQLMGRDLHGKRLGIAGMGRIGQAVARRALAFGMTIHYTGRQPHDLGSSLPAQFHADDAAFLAQCDFLSLHMASTPETRHWLNARRIALLPKGAIVVNTARGDLVDDGALIDGLTRGHVGAAGLDVFAGEPGIDPRYRALPNAMLLPHLGSATIETRCAMGFRALDNLDAFFAGDLPPNKLA
jgi:lactate dehydrogenase-like 2-hydroxyacid dehydrogenase